METQEIHEVHETLRANSYEFGKAGNRFKLYFENPADLKKQIDDLIALGLYSNDVTI
jgi:hypothetical protein